MKVQQQLADEREHFKQMLSTWEPIDIVPKDSANMKTASVLPSNDPEQFAPMRVLPAEEQLPNMTKWTPIDRNFYVDDNKELQNLPYLGDKQIEKVKRKLLEEYYHNNIHGNDVNNFDFAYADMVKLIDALITYQNGDNGRCTVTIEEKKIQ